MHVDFDQGNITRYITILVSDGLLRIHLQSYLANVTMFFALYQFNFVKTNNYPMFCKSYTRIMDFKVISLILKVNNNK